jgi:hypothetical protein
MLFIAYIAFNCFSYLYKDTLLPPGLASQSEDGGGLPPAQFGGSAGGYGGTVDGVAYRDEPTGSATVL